VIGYSIGASGQHLQLSDKVIDHFDRHRQTRFWHREAGGLLFAKFDLYPDSSIVRKTACHRAILGFVMGHDLRRLFVCR
jgi:hypothetical protein